MNLKQLGLKIRELRKEKNLTQIQLANTLGITWEMISRYERGESSPINRLPQLSKALGTNPLELISLAYDLNYVSDQANNQITYITEYKGNNTKQLYSAPDWIIKIDPKALAIDASTINAQKENALYYVSPNSKPTKNDSIITDNGKGYAIETHPAKEKVVGVILAKERRYKSAS